MQYILLGAGFAFAAAVQPGPLQAFLLARVASQGWKRTLPACLAPLLSDGPIALVVLFVLGKLSAVMQHALRAAGGCLLIFFAWATFRQWRRPPEQAPAAKAPRTLLQAVLVNILNPGPYLGWALVLGPTVVSAWRLNPLAAVAVVVAFYGTMTAMLVLFIVLAGTARFLGPRGRRTLLALSALVLALLGISLLIAGLRGLGV
jgi:threonine/homoserine/homoserine lactone efflux protein